MTETLRKPQGYEPCEECGAPLDPQQRYCVNCAARRGNGANPSSRYFAAMGKRARRPLGRPAPKPSPTSRAAAVGFFALLPLAVALGVMVGRGGSGEDESAAILRALRSQEAATASTATPSATAAKRKARNGQRPAKGAGKTGGKVVAHTDNGTVHAVTNFHATKQKEEEDTKKVEENPEQTGENYIKAQQNLPDMIVVGGEPGAAPAPSPGAEP